LYKASALLPPTSLPHPQRKASRLTLVLGALACSIPLEDYLDFTSGYQDPPTIPGCSTPPPVCDAQHISSLSFFGSLSNSVQPEGDYGSQSVDWDLFPADNSDGLSSNFTALPFSPSSAALTGGPFTPDFLFDPDWNAAALQASAPGNYRGDDSQFASGAPSFMTTDSSFPLSNMTTNGGSFHDSTFSSPMLKGTTYQS
jgi:hypothetical protein